MTKSSRRLTSIGAAMDFRRLGDALTKTAVIVGAALWFAAGVAAHADDVPEWLEGREGGPYPIDVFMVADANRVYGMARIGETVWPSWWQMTEVEVPQIATGACTYERSLAAAATRSVNYLLKGQPAWIADIGMAEGKGVLGGTVILSDGRVLSDVLEKFGMARKAGSGSRDPWCGW